MALCRWNHHTITTIKSISLCTNTKWCDLTLVDAHFECVLYNEDYCLSVFPKLKEFYFCAVLPELTDQHYPIQEAKDWIPDKEACVETDLCVTLIINQLLICYDKILV